MEIRPGGERGCPGGRGQSSVIGVVLILGLVITSMTVIATVGGLALLNTEDELSVSRAEKVMTQFDSQSALVALGETNARQTQLVAGNDGEYTLKEGAGWMRISIRNTNTSNTTVVRNGSLGSLTYETDGTRLAYQGGGVWEKGDGDAVMVSPPEFHYRDRTLTLPVINVTGDNTVSGQVTVRQSGISKEYPNETLVNPVPTEREVVVTVKSEYYRGWGSYFERRTDGDVSYDDANRTASITLTVPITESFDDAVTGTGNVDGKAVDGTYVEGATRPSATTLIEDEIDDCGSNSSPDADGTVTNGTYCEDSDLTFDSVTFDTTSGDIDVVVNGTVEFTGDSTITGDGNVTLYTKGLVVSGSDTVNGGGDPSRLLTYVHSDVDEIEINGNAQYTGLIYAPNSDLTINGGGNNNNIVGGIVIRDLVGNGNPATVTQNTAVGREIEFVGDAGITYLHISENRIEITDG